MIIYDRILERLKNSGYSTYRLEKEKIISPSTLDNIRKGKPISTRTVDIICTLCHCTPGDILKHKEQNENGTGD